MFVVLGQIVANNHRVQYLPSFDKGTCLRGSGRREVLILVGFLRETRGEIAMRGVCVTGI